MAGFRNTFVLGFFVVVLGPVIGGGYIANRNLQNRAVAEVREQIYPTACAYYKGMTTWQRWTTPLGWQDGWCDDYLDRM